MHYPTLSFKKRLLLVVGFGLFFVMLLLASLLVKKSPPSKQLSTITPTTVPLDQNQPTRQPGSVSIESSPASADNSLGTVSFKYLSINIPKSGAVYTQAPTSIPADTISKIQEKLIAGGNERIINTPQGQVIFMQKDTKTLTIYLYSRMVVYTDAKQTSSSAPGGSDMIKKAADFISSLNLPFDSSLPKTAYFVNSSGDLVQSDNPTAADITDVSFSESVQGLTVYRQYGSGASTHVWFSKDGSLIKFTYFYSPQYEPQKSITLPTITEAEEMIRNNKGIIVSLGKDYQQSPLSKIERTELTSVEVGYFNDEQGGYLYPIFVFRGTSLTADGQKPVVVYLPVGN